MIAVSLEMSDEPKKSRTRQRGGVRLYAVYVLRCVFPHVSNFFGNPADEDFLQ